MPVLDYDRILNENPSKKLRIAHENLTKNFTEESAKDYSDLYMGKPLPFLLENSRYIFSEPLYGYDYYVEQVLGDKNVLECIQYYPEELDKVSAYLEEYGPNMDPENREMYESLETKLSDKVDGSKILRSFLAFETSHFEDLDPQYTEHPIVYLTTAPFFMAMEDADTLSILERANEIMSIADTDSDDQNNWKLLFEAMVASGKLQEDSLYNEFVEKYTSPMYRKMLGVLSHESLARQVDSIDIITEKDDTFREYASSSSAVEAIFEIMESAEIYDDEYRKDRERIDNLKGYAYNLVKDLVVEEYNYCDDATAPIGGYFGLFKEGTTIEDAMNIIAEEADKYEFIEESDDDDLGEPSKTVRSEIGYIREETPRKKPTPPTNKTTARKMTLKAMDVEKGYYKSKAKASERGEDIKGAVSAIAAIPKDIKSDIDRTIRKWDDADDERRRAFMTEPGFRKEIFKKLKLALMYGAAASANLLLVPVCMLCRRISKQKDRRIKKELSRELDAEIEICSEKINDANSAGDNQSKYKLMRIKSKLEQEKLRVMTNSKYI